MKILFKDHLVSDRWFTFDLELKKKVSVLEESLDMLKSLWGGGSQEQSSDGGSKEEDEKKNESGGEGDSDKAGGASSFGYWTKGLGGKNHNVSHRLFLRMTY